MRWDEFLGRFLGHGDRELWKRLRRRRRHGHPTDDLLAMGGLADRHCLGDSAPGQKTARGLGTATVIYVAANIMLFTGVG
jgi:hypothetical protein